MSATKHCGKHDVIFPESGTCWCCEQAKGEKAKPEARSKTKQAKVPAATSNSKG